VRFGQPCVSGFELGRNRIGGARDRGKDDALNGVEDVEQKGGVDWVREIGTGCRGQELEAHRRRVRSQKDHGHAFNRPGPEVADTG